MMNKIQWPVFLCCFIGAAILIPDTAWSQATRPEGSQVVAVVNQTPITALELDEAVNSLLPRAFGHRQLSEERIAEIKKEVLEDLIQKELLYQEAKRKNIQISPQEIEAGVTKIRKRFSSEKEFMSALKKSGLTLEKVRFGIERFLAIGKVLAEVDSRLKVEAGDLADHQAVEKRRRQWLEELRAKAEIRMFQ